MLSFANFRLDFDSERLWKGEREVQLRRKPFAILRFLVQNPKRLVTHDELIEAVWGKIAMSESLLRTHMCHLRAALGDACVETVVGRGYRFIAEIEQIDADERALALRSDDDSTERFVGRESELEALHSALRSVRERKRTTVFVTGEAGVGKTTLIDVFIKQASERGQLFVGRGACVEQYGTGQAYLPVLDAVGALCRGPNSARALDIFAEHAPTWLAQMPALVPPERLPQLQRRSSGATQGRTLRELAEAFDALSAEAPVVIVFDDLQWTDPSTAEFVAFFARRREPVRLLMVGMYRSTSVPRGHPMSSVSGELIARREASSFVLNDLGPEAVDAYLSRRFSRHRFPVEFAPTLHQSTGGNPLFVITLVDELVGKHHLFERDGGEWELSTSIEEVAALRPDSIRRLIDTQIDRLPAFGQRIVETAAVAGASFTAGVVAHALAADVDEVDSTCESLANERRFLKYEGAERWPDGTIQSRYSFGHSLIQHAALARSTSASVRATHRKIAERLEAGHASSAEKIATELAAHFDCGQISAKAAHYHIVAGDRAGYSYGLLEAVAHYEAAGALLTSLPEGRERDLLELRAKLPLAWRLFQRDGSTDAAMPLLERSRDLAVLLGEQGRLAEALIRLEYACTLRGEMRKAREHARAAAPLLGHVPDALRTLGQDLDAITVLIQGNLREALELFDSRGIFRTTNGHGATEAKGRLLAMAHGSFALWLAGNLDDAIDLARRGYAAAEAMDDPWERAALLAEWAVLHALRREPVEAQALANRSLRLAEEGAFGVWKHRVDLVLRWAEVELAPAVAEERAEELLSKPWTSVSLGRTLPLMLFAATCVRLGRTDTALAVLSETLGSLAQSDERWLEPELHRLRGEVIASRDVREAKRSFAKAIEVARTNGAITLELRATLSLHKVTSGVAKTRARNDLARLLTLVAGGKTAPDVAEACRVVGN